MEGNSHANLERDHEDITQSGECTLEIPRYYRWNLSTLPHLEANETSRGDDASCSLN